jgi:hypothetical protein
MEDRSVQALSGLANKERMAPEPYSFLPASDPLSDDTAKRWTEILADAEKAEVNPDELGIARPPAIPESSPEPPTGGMVARSD